ncbi:MAG: 2-oxoglutarate dehydrogenase complex dihydrolipoyllysine-residue succinyltransferase [Phycisphaerales bacterium]|nr:MAG: 2-oxoglutarate dehydrogenase complex dihydrolipoyllysine-residue succinyltransferase [Phycisphaerales bacterium]
MATDIVIPTVGESVTSGVVAAWLKSDGDYVERDEPVMELETDKVTMEIPAPAAGVLKRGASEGDDVEVGAVVGTIDESAEKPAGGSASEQKPAAKREGGSDADGGGAKGAVATEPKPHGESKASEAKASESQVPAKQAPSASAPNTNGTANGASAGGGAFSATPLAKKLADERGLDLSRVVGTGAGGRIREQDVLAALQAGTASGGGGSGGSASAGGGASRATSVERMSPMRQRIASRLVEAQHTAAMLTTFNECDMSAVLSLRKQYKDRFGEQHGVGLGFMSFFVKACVNALRAFPLVNAYITEDEQGKPSIQKHDYCDIALAVASPKGLVVPVLRNCETLSFAGIERGVKELATKARDGKITLEDMTGGTFTITNGGIFGSLMSTPILNPPQSAILGMHAIKNRAVEHPSKPGEVAIRPMMYLALSYDHRIVDGAEAVQFLVKIKEAIEDPQRLMLEL